MFTSAPWKKNVTKFIFGAEVRIPGVLMLVTWISSSFRLRHNEKKGDYSVTYPNLNSTSKCNQVTPFYLHQRWVLNQSQGSWTIPSNEWRKNWYIRLISLWVQIRFFSTFFDLDFRRWAFNLNWQIHNLKSKIILLDSRNRHHKNIFKTFDFE